MCDVLDLCVRLDLEQASSGANNAPQKEKVEDPSAVDIKGDNDTGECRDEDTEKKFSQSGNGEKEESTAAEESPSTREEKQSETHSTTVDTMSISSSPLPPSSLMVGLGAVGFVVGSAFLLWWKWRRFFR